MKWTFKSGSTRTRIVLAFHAALLDVSLARVEITPAGYCWTRQSSMSLARPIFDAYTHRLRVIAARHRGDRDVYRAGLSISS